MAGGTFLVQNKTRPGAYIQFKSVGKSLGTLSDRGVMAIPLVLDWGEVKTPIEITAETDVVETLGHSLLDEEMRLVYEGTKRANKIIVYRVNEGDKAQATLEGLTVTAKYPGTRGNALVIAVLEDVDNAGFFTVTTYLDGDEVDSQEVQTIEALLDNAYVTFKGTGELTETAGLTLSGGTTGDTTSQDYLDYFSAMEKVTFNTLAFPVEDITLKGALVSFIKRMREDEGKKVQGVLANYPLADYEGIISVKNGVRLADGTVLNATAATSWVAGATAGANVNESNTYSAYDDSVGVDEVLTHSQIVEALQKGEWVFVESDGQAVVEQDINTFTSFSTTKDSSFRKNRVIRVLDAIGNDMQTIFSKYYIGKVDNNADGRKLFKGECVNYFDTLQALSAIQNFDATEDIVISQGDDVDNVVAEVAIQPVDSMEKLYMTVTVG